MNVSSVCAATPSTSLLLYFHVEQEWQVCWLKRHHEESLKKRQSNTPTPLPPPPALICSVLLPLEMRLWVCGRVDRWSICWGRGGGVDACFSLLPLSTPPWDVPLPSISLIPYLHFSVASVLLNQQDLLVWSGSPFTQMGLLERQRGRRWREGVSGEGEKNSPRGSKRVIYM